MWSFFKCAPGQEFNNNCSEGTLLPVMPFSTQIGIIGEAAGSLPHNHWTSAAFWYSQSQHACTSHSRSFHVQYSCTAEGADVWIHLGRNRSHDIILNKSKRINLPTVFPQPVSLNSDNIASTTLTHCMCKIAVCKQAGSYLHNTKWLHVISIFSALNHCGIYWIYESIPQHINIWNKIVPVLNVNLLGDPCHQCDLGGQQDQWYQRVRRNHLYQEDQQDRRDPGSNE